MTHDPLCKFSKRKAADDHYDDGCDYCDLITKVRADERSKHEAEIEHIYESWSVDVEHHRYH